MGERELCEALRREAQTKIRSVWQVAEAEVSTRRAEVAREISRLCTASWQRQTAEAAAVRRALLAIAEQTARQRLLVAESFLLERLRQLVVQRLPVLDVAGRSRYWCILAADLPAAAWQRVRVHPEDVERARQRFPGAEIIVEAKLGGGLIVETVDGRIVVDNSLRGWLERTWPERQILLLALIREEVGGDAVGFTTVD